jgi:hypothetical protein
MSDPSSLLGNFERSCPHIILVYHASQWRSSSGAPSPRETPVLATSVTAIPAGSAKSIHEHRKAIVTACVNTQLHDDASRRIKSRANKSDKDRHKPDTPWPAPFFFFQPPRSNALTRVLDRHQAAPSICCPSPSFVNAWGPLTSRAPVRSFTPRFITQAPHTHTRAFLVCQTFSKAETFLAVR